MKDRSIKDQHIPRATKLRSQRDINLWRVPLWLSLGAVVLFGITLITDILDSKGTIHLTSWVTMTCILPESSGIHHDTGCSDPSTRSNRRLVPRLPIACRQELSDQANAIHESAILLASIDRHDLDAA